MVLNAISTFPHVHRSWNYVSPVAYVLLPAQTAVTQIPDFVHMNLVLCNQAVKSGLLGSYRLHRDHYLNYSHNDTAPNLEHTCCEWDISLDHVAYTDLCHYSPQPHSPSLLVAATLTAEFPHGHPDDTLSTLLRFQVCFKETQELNEADVTLYCNTIFRLY
jgi:hypothetical protein